MPTVNRLPQRMPSREATAYQWLRVDNLLSPTVEPIISAYADGDLMTREEFFQSLDHEAAIKHLEWLRGLRLSVGSMAEVLGAAVDGEYEYEEEDTE